MDAAVDIVAGHHPADARPVLTFGTRDPPVFVSHETPDRSFRRASGNEGGRAVHGKRLEAGFFPVVTAVQHDLLVIAIVMDNRVRGAEKACQCDFFGGRFLGVDLHNPPFATFAELVGAAGYRATRPGQTAEALKARRPAVIHVDVDPDAIQSLRKDLFTKD